MLGKIIFIILLLAYLANTFHSYRKVSWQRNLLIPHSQLSPESLILCQFFNSSGQSSFSSLWQLRKKLNISISDGSKSNFTKRIEMSLLELSFKKLGSYLEEKSSFQASNLSVHIKITYANLSKDNNDEGRTVVKQSALPYSLKMEGGEKLTISSKELALSLHTRPVEVQSFFQTFLLTQYINFSAIMLFFLVCLTINILVCYYDSLNIHSHFFAVFAMEMRINLTMIFTSVAVRPQFNHQVGAYYFTTMLESYTYIYFALLYLADFVLNYCCLKQLNIDRLIYFALVAVLALQPGEHSLMILTVHHLTFLSKNGTASASTDGLVSKERKIRATVVVMMMLLMHILQISLWTNPGPCLSIFDQLSFNPTTISVPSILLIDLNGLAAIDPLRQANIRLLKGWVRSMLQFRSFRGGRKDEQKHQILLKQSVQLREMFFDKLEAKQQS